MKDIGISQITPSPDIIVDDVVRSNRYLVLRQMGVSSKVITGIHKLAQYVTKLILTTQGSDKFDPEYGSSILYLLRDSKSIQELTDIKGQLAVHVSDILKQVIKEQTNASLPADERLKDLQLLRAEFDNDTLSLDVDLRLISEAGTARVLNLSEVLAEA